MTVINEILKSMIVSPFTPHYAGWWEKIIMETLDKEGKTEEVEHDYIHTGRRVMQFKPDKEPLLYRITIEPIYPPKKEKAENDQ